MTSTYWKMQHAGARFFAVVKRLELAQIPEYMLSLMGLRLARMVGKKIHESIFQSVNKK